MRALVGVTGAECAVKGSGDDALLADDSALNSAGYSRDARCTDLACPFATPASTTEDSGDSMDDEEVAEMTGGGRRKMGMLRIRTRLPCEFFITGDGGGAGSFMPSSAGSTDADADEDGGGKGGGGRLLL